MESKQALSLAVMVLMVGLLGLFIYTSGKERPFLADDRRESPAGSAARPLAPHDEVRSQTVPSSPLVPIIGASLFALLGGLVTYVVIRKRHAAAEANLPQDGVGQQTYTFASIIGLIQALVGLQWLLTGIAKWRSPDFANRFTVDLAETIHEEFIPENWYHQFIDVRLVPHGDVLATTVVALEIAIGTILLLGAIDWLLGHRIIRRSLHATLAITVLTALLIGIFLDWNVSFVQGIAFSVSGGGGVFDKAISLDFFLIFLSLILIAADVIDLRRSKREIEPEEPASPEKTTIVAVPDGEPKVAAESGDIPKPPEKIPSELLPTEGSDAPQPGRTSMSPQSFPTTDTAIIPVPAPQNTPPPPSNQPPPK